MKKLTAAQQYFFNNVTLIAALRLIFAKLEKSQVSTYRLVEVAETMSGGTPDRQNGEYYGGNIPWIKSGELKDGLIEDAEEYITDEALRNSSARVFPKGTLVVALYGATVGKTGILAIDASSNQAVCAIIPKTNTVSIKFLHWFFRYKRQDFLNISFGGAQPNISQKIIRETCVPIPTVELQNRICEFLEAVERRQKGEKKVILPDLPPPLEKQIVARIEELAAKIEEARGLRAEVEEEIEALFPSILSKATSSSFGAFQNLNDICLQVTDGEHATPQRVDSSDVPLVTAKNVRDGYLDLRNTDFVIKDIVEKCWKRCQPQHEDILMVCVGATIGRVCRLVNPPPMVIVRSVALLRPNRNVIDPRFLEYALESSECQSQIWDSVKKAAQPCLYIHRMKLLSIPVPPLSEQRRIVAYLDELQAKVDALRRLQAETGAELDALLPAVLDRAFKGEL